MTAEVVGVREVAAPSPADTQRSLPALRQERCSAFQLGDLTFLEEGGRLAQWGLLVGPS